MTGGVRYIKWSSGARLPRSILGSPKTIRGHYFRKLGITLTQRKRRCIGAYFRKNLVRRILTKGDEADGKEDKNYKRSNGEYSKHFP